MVLKKNMRDLGRKLPHDPQINSSFQSGTLPSFFCLGFKWTMVSSPGLCGQLSHLFIAELFMLLFVNCREGVRVSIV